MFARRTLKIGWLRDGPREDSQCMALVVFRQEGAGIKKNVGLFSYLYYILTSDALNLPFHPPPPPAHGHVVPPPPRHPPPYRRRARSHRANL